MFLITNLVQITSNQNTNITNRESINQPVINDVTTAYTGILNQSTSMSVMEKPSSPVPAPPHNMVKL